MAHYVGKVRRNGSAVAVWVLRPIVSHPKLPAPPKLAQPGVPTLNGRTFRQETAVHLCNNCAIQHLPRATQSDLSGSHAAL